jgi:hypothetical protein
MMSIWIVWNGELAPEGRAIVEIFSDERAAYEFVNDGECTLQGHPNVSTEEDDGEPSDDIECFVVSESVAESHAGYIEVLRRRMIRDMSSSEREAMRVEWDDENDVERAEKGGGGIDAAAC